jgi:predicted dehydrogenase
MPNKLRWGILSSSHFAFRQFVPGLLQAELAETVAVASRDRARAKEFAAAFGIPKVYASYEELLADRDIDVIYNPLPNHLHVPWSIRAAEAGKHVLCEKPLALNAAGVRELIAARERTGRQIGEGFMVRTHPQWLRARELVRGGAIGELRAVEGFFSYYNDDPANIRNRAEVGGGGLLDIGCYPITISRFLFGEEPTRVCAIVERDPVSNIDRLTSAMLQFPAGHSLWTVATQLAAYQRIQAIGTTGRIEIPIPFNALTDRPMRILIDDGSDLDGAGIRVEEVEVCDQYTLEADAFSRAILEGREVPVPLEDSLQNMAVIDAVFRSAETGRWEPVEA